MPAISMFYGIIIYIYFFDTEKHHKPHLHAEYGEYSAALSIEDGEVLSGHLPKKKLRMVQAWISIHEDELLANWKLASSGKEPFKISPLK
ncbi:MAG: DUF4160 domain-containing protein [Pseudomonadota bacterium]